MSEKKESGCGCGCMPETKKGSENRKPEEKKPKKK
jgi:hypothetical protein